MKLNGKYALVTGGSQGLGKSVAKAFLDEGASVLICARDGNALAKTKEELAEGLSNNQRIITQVANVSKEDQMDSLFDYAYSQFPTLDILVGNAGIYGPKGCIEDVDWAQWVEAISINLLGLVYSCRKVLPQFKKQKKGKILILAGGGATSPMPRVSSYAASKAGVVRFAETLAKEVMGFGIDVNSIAPGALNTRLLYEVLEAGPEKVGKDFYQKAVMQEKEGGASMDNAAELCVFLASPESDGITGRLISAVWDPWETFPDHLDEIESSDVYTLRRIVPEDRGMTLEND
ncbi:MAG: SDR family oxidoreductase [Nitrospinaceae bacterium]|jgi:NAD(P)-dependent dehydrogenase (short-subunit alcohol dehydrogenase family)|nr:SDR family oxidoreductase [Nitrospina sp.]MBT5868093.1 SDR family oxidoreductase [Nitrospinaceae bacterium]